MAKPGGHKRWFAMATAIAIASCSLAAAGCGRSGPGGDTNSMTVEHKVGQLLLVGFEGTSMTPQLEDLLETVHPGGVILFSRNVSDAGQLGSLIRSLQEVAMADSGQPLFVAVDQEGGQVRRLSWLDETTAQSDIASSEQAYDLGRRRADALAQLGINLNLAPVLDIAAPGDFLYRYNRVLPGTPQDIGTLGLNVIRGQQEGGIFSAAKHFPGYGGITYNPETDAIPVLPSLPETSQFQIAAGAQPEFVMTANVVYESIDPDLPFTLSAAGIRFLRETLPGDYLIITDDLASKVLQERFTLPGATVLAAEAGADVLLLSSIQQAEVVAAYERLLQTVAAGQINQGSIDDRVFRIVQLKQQLARP